MTGKVDFTKDTDYGSIQKGETFDKVFTLKNPDKSLMNLTNYACDMQVRKSVGSTVVLDLNSYDTNSYIILGGTAGTLRILVSDEITKTLSVGKYLYDLFLTTPSGTTIKLFEGSIDVIGSITVV